MDELNQNNVNGFDQQNSSNDNSQQNMSNGYNQQNSGSEISQQSMNNGYNQQNSSNDNSQQNMNNGYYQQQNIDNNNYQYGNGQYNQQQQPYNSDSGNNGKATAALILGIISIVIVFIPYFSIIGLGLGIVGTIVGSQAKKQNPSSTATAGFVLSLIGLIISAISFVGCFALAGLIGMAGGEINDIINSYY